MRRGWLRPKQKCFQFTLETHEVYVLSYRCGSKLFHAHWPVNGIPVVASVYWIALSCPLMNNVHFCSINQAIGCKYRLQNYFSSVGRGMWYSETIKFYSLNYRWILYIPRCTVYVNGNGYVDMWILAMYHLLWRLYRNRYTYRQSSSIFVNTLDKYYLILLSILHFCSFDRLSHACPTALLCFTLRWKWRCYARCTVPQFTTRTTSKQETTTTTPNGVISIWPLYGPIAGGTRVTIVGPMMTPRVVKAVHFGDLNNLPVIFGLAFFFASNITLSNKTTIIRLQIFYTKGCPKRRC